MNNDIGMRTNQIPPSGRNELVDNSVSRHLPLRSRSPGDEDGAHQGIVSLMCFFKIDFRTFSMVFPSFLECVMED